MKDLWHSITKWVDYNRYLFVGILLTLAVSGWMIGCASKTIGPVSGLEVPREAFIVEYNAAYSALVQEAADIDADIAKHNEKIAALEAAGDVGIEDLNRQDEVKRQVISLAGGLAASAATGTITPAAIINGIVTAGAVLVGGGAVIDNRRKDAKLAERSSAGTATT